MKNKEACGIKLVDVPQRVLRGGIRSIRHHYNAPRNGLVGSLADIKKAGYRIVYNEESPIALAFDGYEQTLVGPVSVAGSSTKALVYKGNEQDAFIDRAIENAKRAKLPIRVALVVD